MEKELDGIKLEQSKDFAEISELTDEHLDFSALSNGLGFHKKRDVPKLSGSGANSAGPARLAKNIPNTVIKKSTNKSVATKEKKVLQSSKALPHISEPGASVGIRSSAFLIDFAFVGMVLYIAFAFNFSFLEQKSLLVTSPITALAFFYIILTSYFLLAESFGGRSLGKMLLNLRIVEDDKYQKPIGLYTAAMRSIAFPICFIPAGIGLFYAFFDSKSRPWHDRVTTSIVRKSV